MLAEFVVADEGTERSSAEDAVFFFIDLLEQRALIELRGFLDIAEEFLLGHIEDADFELCSGLAVIHQVLKTAPGSLELLESGMVHDLVELNRQEMINLRDARIDHHFGILGN